MIDTPSSAQSGTDRDQPFEIVNSAGKGRVVLICEHASPNIPQEYNGLGLKPDDRMSHAAWDPGARDVSMHLSEALDAPLIMSTVSRLVYDCNRPPDADSAMPEASELVKVPGNRNLSPEDRRARTKAVYEPFCLAVSSVLDARPSTTVVVTVHSFTPVYFGRQRTVEIGLLHDQDARLVDAMLDVAEDILPHRKVQRNEPYGPNDGVTHSLKLHALSRGMPHVMVEIRNDLLRDTAGVQTLATEVLTMLEPAIGALAEIGDHE